MKAEWIRHVLNREASRIKHFAKKADHTFKKDDIHDFRVAFKTLRGVIGFLNTTRQSHEFNIPKKVKRLYHIAGALRDAQLELEDIQTQHILLPEYQQHLHLIVKTQKKNWKKSYCAKPFNKLSKRIDEVDHTTIHRADFAAFFKGKLASITAIAEMSQPTDDEIHQVRKEAKDIIYVSEIEAQYWHKSHDIVEELPSKQLKEITEKIGGYHDDTVRITHMSLFSSPKMTQEEQATIINMCSDGKQKLLAVKNEILQMVRELKITETATVPVLY